MRGTGDGLVVGFTVRLARPVADRGVRATTLTVDAVDWDAEIDLLLAVTGLA